MTLGREQNNQPHLRTQINNLATTIPHDAIILGDPKAPFPLHENPALFPIDLFVNVNTFSQVKWLQVTWGEMSGSACLQCKRRPASSH